MTRVTLPHETEVAPPWYRHARSVTSEVAVLDDASVVREHGLGYLEGIEGLAPLATGAREVCSLRWVGDQPLDLGSEADRIAGSSFDAEAIALDQFGQSALVADYHGASSCHGLRDDPPKSLVA